MKIWSTLTDRNKNCRQIKPAQTNMILLLQNFRTDFRNDHEYTEDNIPKDFLPLPSRPARSFAFQSPAPVVKDDAGMQAAMHFPSVHFNTRRVKIPGFHISIRMPIVSMLTRIGGMSLNAQKTLILSVPLLLNNRQMQFPSKSKYPSFDSPSVNTQPKNTHLQQIVRNWLMPPSAACCRKHRVASAGSVFSCPSSVIYVPWPQGRWLLGPKTRFRRVCHL